MIILKATEYNWGLVGPGDWDKIKWKIEDSGWYQYTKSYRSGDSGIVEIPALTEEGQMSSGEMEALKDLLNREWSEEKALTSDGTAWEFKMYENNTVIKHRPEDSIDGIEPYESIAAILRKTNGDAGKE